MTIDKLPEFAKDGQKNTDDLVLTDGFPVLKKPARQWFNWLFNSLSLKTNEIIDEVDTKLAKSSDLSDLTSAATARTNLGLGTAATVNISTSYIPPSGQALKKGDFGLGAGTSGWSTFPTMPSPNLSLESNKELPTGFYTKEGSYTLHMKLPSTGLFARLIIPSGYSDDVPQPTILVQTALYGLLTYTLRNSRNTTVDSNGFLKNASPIVQLFADKIELNDEAQQQNIEFEKLGVGDYLIKNSTGLSNDGWYIEQPKDANGNVYHAVIYEQLENGDISVKTFEQKLEGTKIVADLDRPVDIKENRFISIRLNELPQDVTAPQNPNVVDSEGNPAPSKDHVLKDGIWVISDEDAEILAAEKYQMYLQSLKPLTRRQFKLALLENGLLDQIENSISAIEDDQTRARIQIEYTEATEFHRMSDSVAYMCQLLGLTDEQVNQMWESALTL